MIPPGPATMMRIYLGDADRVHGGPAYHAIVERLRALGLAGATVTHGIEGFGSKQHLHTDRLLTLSVDLPVVVEVVDTEERIRAVDPGDRRADRRRDDRARPGGGGCPPLAR